MGEMIDESAGRTIAEGLVAAGLLDREGKHDSGGGVVEDETLSSTVEFVPEPKQPSRWRRVVASLAALATFGTGTVGLAEPAGAGGGYRYDGAKPTGLLSTWYIDKNGNGRFDGVNSNEWYDEFGYGYRNCTSGAAFWQSLRGVTNIRGMGNAKNWDDAARARGFSVDKSPRVGDTAVSEAGDFGHVADVIAVDNKGTATTSDDTVRVREYNASPPYGGTYGERSGLKFDWYIHFGGNASATVPVAPSNPPRFYPREEFLHAADFNGDGYDDLFTASRRADPAQNELVWKGGPGGLAYGELWGSPSQLPFGDDTINMPADIDGDGKDDLISITNNHSDGAPNIWWQRSTGTSFGPPQLVGIPPVIAKNTRWMTGDVTGDGKDDVVALGMRGDPGANLFVFRGGGWLGGIENWGATESNIPFADTDFSLGDMNGDGKADLMAVAPLAGHREAQVYQLRSTGANFMGAVLTAAVTGFNYGGAKFTPFRLNNDPATDFLVSTQRSDTAPNLQAWQSDSNASYNWMSLLSSPAEFRWADTQYVPADIDHDGDQDLIGIQRHTASGWPEFWLARNVGYRFDSPTLMFRPDMDFYGVHFQS